MSRFRGAIAALVLLAAVVIISIAAQQTLQVPTSEPETSNLLFSFEEEDLVGVLVERPDSTVEYAKQDGRWTVVGRPWIPSETMLRRVAHQLHALEARARVAGADADPEQFGLGAKSNRVTLRLTPGPDGSERTLRFRVGDPNPSSVSFYIQPEGRSVYIVQKAAVDYYGLALDEFRERRFAAVSADSADAITVRIDGNEKRFRRSSEERWAMEVPVAQAASRSMVRTMLGRTGALKAREFVEDAPAELGKYGLSEPHAEIQIGLSSGETITLKVGDVVAVDGEEREHRYIYRTEHDSVYVARSGFLEAFSESVEAYRNRKIMQRANADLTTIRVEADGRAITLRRSGPRDWLWEDSSPVSGSTPRRLATQLLSLEAQVFFDDGAPAQSQLDAPGASVVLSFGEGEDPSTVHFGALEESEDDIKRRYVSVEGEPVAYSVRDAVMPIIQDLLREHRRKTERDAEKAIRDEAAEGEAG